MGLLNKKVYAPIAEGQYTFTIKEIVEVEPNPVTKVDGYVNFKGIITELSDRPFTDCRFEKGLYIMCSQLKEVYFPGDQEIEVGTMLNSLVNKPIQIWISYNEDQQTGKVYTNVHYQAPKKSTKRQAVNVNL